MTDRASDVQADGDAEDGGPGRGVPAHHLVATRWTAARLAWDAALGLLLAPSSAVLLLLLVALAVVSVRRTDSVGALLAVGVVVVLLVPGLALLTWRSTRALAPPGAVLALGSGETALSVTFARGDVLVPYTSIRRIRVVGATVIVVLGRGSSAVVLPRALLGDDLPRLRAAVAGAAHER